MKPFLLKVKIIFAMIGNHLAELFQALFKKK